MLDKRVPSRIKSIRGAKRGEQDWSINSILPALTLIGDTQQQDQSQHIHPDKYSIGQCVVTIGNCEQNSHQGESSLLQQRGNGRYQTVGSLKIMPAIHGNDQRRHQIQQAADAKAHKENGNIDEDLHLCKNQQQ